MDLAPLLDPARVLLRIRFRWPDVADQLDRAGLVGACRRRELGNPWDNGASSFYLAELDAVPAHFDLVVIAADEFQRAGRQLPGPVARPVHPRPCRRERVGQEPDGCRSRLPQVAERHARPAYIELTGHAVRHEPEPVIEHVEVGVGHRRPDGDAAAVPGISRIAGRVVPGRGDGRLGRAVGVQQPYVPAWPVVPGPDQPGFEPVAAGNHEPYPGGHLLVGVGELAYPRVPSRCRQVQGRDAVLAHQRAERGEGIGYERDPGARVPGTEELFHGHIHS